jgi:hypothetical protein
MFFIIFSQILNALDFFNFRLFFHFFLI